MSGLPLRMVCVWSQQNSSFFFFSCWAKCLQFLADECLDAGPSPPTPKMKYGGTESKPKWIRMGGQKWEARRKGLMGKLRLVGEGVGGWLWNTQCPLSLWQTMSLRPHSLGQRALKTFLTTNHYYVLVKLSRLWLNKVIKAKSQRTTTTTTAIIILRRMTTPLTRLPEHISWRREHSSAVSIVPFCSRDRSKGGQKSMKCQSLDNTNRTANKHISVSTQCTFMQNPYPHLPGTCPLEPKEMTC